MVRFCNIRFESDKGSSINLAHINLKLKDNINFTYLLLCTLLNSFPNSIECIRHIKILLPPLSDLGYLQITNVEKNKKQVKQKKRRGGTHLNHVFWIC